ncbi:hypothetical protein P170DRAFT_74557 [Aspergillus steynii IBT 23096]|uniref:Uncharacterized protein n=1 Tax=Aspergillus steynii IBT 23096 TaxID=1392250 RepID=A0A2I2FRH3_9EURO|nr:uncharacterized protein P170DRAFT_74557 [Aspergillus steynii IBT 23096]PLB43233.1 hypothetical protein P170DRAFT_74557 [Aspergillus steynii IBT 23096]
MLDDVGQAVEPINWRAWPMRLFAASSPSRSPPNLHLPPLPAHPSCCAWTLSRHLPCTCIPLCFSSSLGCSRSLAFLCCLPSSPVSITVDFRPWLETLRFTEFTGFEIR